MSDENSTEQAFGGAMTDDELAVVVGGNGDPIDPTPNATDAPDESGKATPIPF